MKELSSIYTVEGRALSRESDKPPFSTVVVGWANKDSDGYFRFYSPRYMTCKDLRNAAIFIGNLNTEIDP